jgi:hypothetical protein
MRLRFLATVAALSFTAGGLSAESLGELARKEKRRRAKCKSTNSKVYTEADLKSARQQDEDKEPDDAPATQPSTSPSPEQERRPVARTGSGGYPRQTEQYWRQRKRSLEDAVQRAEERLAKIEEST